MRSCWPAGGAKPTNNTHSRFRATVAEPSGHLATLERSCYGAGSNTLMQSISDTIVYRKPPVAPVCSALQRRKIGRYCCVYGDTRSGCASETSNGPGWVRSIVL